ncbi:hypothetical protein QFC19_000440 [Naganishia cerealis]|uniref:Uncharacterized protein n=1 Tax=Naganishia cerealis TaxID=610337 RepID=A0ACC2WMA9_9TREE|nr:hypothetical protein QFC19_000440 [Naganishia cerealis]
MDWALIIGLRKDPILRKSKTGTPDPSAEFQAREKIEKQAWDREYEERGKRSKEPGGFAWFQPKKETGSGGDSPQMKQAMSSTPPRKETSLPGSQRMTSPLSPTSSRFTTGTASLNLPWQTSTTGGPSTEGAVSTAAITAAMSQPNTLGFNASTSPQPTPDVNVITSGGSSTLINNAELPQARSKEKSRKGSSGGEEKTESSQHVSGEEPVILGVCAMDVKARSKAMREILTRLVEIEKGGVNVKLFGDMVILEEDITHWPPVDVLISFFSKDFPLAKAIAYTQIPNITRPPPISINSLAMQALLWDRRLVLAILDHIGVPTPMRAEVNRDGGPRVHPRLRERVRRDLGLVLPGTKSEEEETWDDPIIPERWVQSRAKAKASGGLKSEVPRSKEVILREDGNAIIVGGTVIEKPFVEKPVDGEDHNVYIYHRNGGGRRLFRKVGNKSSEQDPTLWHPRTNGSFIYEEFINVDNAEDIKIYTVGPNFSHAETRKSPVVDGLVRRNADGKETRFITQLSPEEKGWAKDIVEAFGQRVCGFDLLRCTEDTGIRSLIIDVNGWSFVKGNQAYYDKAAEILSNVCKTARERKRKYAQADAVANGITVSKPKVDQTVVPSSSVLRATVTVLRHADRTPKMKLKFTFPANEAWTKPFLRLLRGHREEIILRDARQLQYILDAADETARLGCTPEVAQKLANLKDVLARKTGLAGTKAQLKPGFYKKDKVKDKNGSADGKKKKGEDDDGEATETDTTRERVKEWIEESGSLATPTPAHAAPAALPPPVPSPTPIASQSPDHIPTPMGSPPNLPTRPETPALSSSQFIQEDEADQQPSDEDLIPEGLEKLQLVVKWGGESTHSARYQARDLGDTFKKDLMIMNKDVLNNVKIYTSSERRVVNTAQIFAHALLGKENNTPAAARKPEDYDTPQIEHIIQRRDLLDDNNAAKELTDQVKKKLKILLRPGESEKRPELAWPKSLKKEPVEVVKEVMEQMAELREIMERNYENGNVDKLQVRWCSNDSAFLFRERYMKMFDDFTGKGTEKFDPARISELYDSLKFDSLHHRQFLLAVFDPEGKGDVKNNTEGGDRRLHELFARIKALFELVAPQEYGIDMKEKEEIGVLTSLPLLRKVVQDLVEARDTGKSTANFYFTKESHIISYYHLLLTSGLPFLKDVRIEELDYASSLTIELYERHSGGSEAKNYSMRLSVSEGAHASSVLDSAVDARHTLTVQPRKKLTSHVDFDLALESLTKHFNKGLSFSTTPLEGDEVYLRKRVADEAVLPLSLSKHGDDTPRHFSSAASDRTYASEML